MISALASLVRAGEEGENAFPEENRILDGLVDPIGTLYKYAFAKYGRVLKELRQAAGGGAGMRKITIDPITRLEGHGKIIIYLDEEESFGTRFCRFRSSGGLRPFVGAGGPRKCLRSRRGFAAFVRKPIIWPRPRPWMLLSVRKSLKPRASSANFSTTPTFSPTTFCTSFSSAARIFAFRKTWKRGNATSLGSSGAFLSLGKKWWRCAPRPKGSWRSSAGKRFIPFSALPGGVARPLSEEERKEILAAAENMVELGKTMIRVFHEEILPRPDFQALLLSEEGWLPTHYMGLVDENLAPNFYDGLVRVISAEGKEIFRLPGPEALNKISEHSEPWTYVKFPYLAEFGWQGFRAGADSGIYRVGPLARLNVAERMATPLAQEEYERYLDFFGEKPVHATFAYHWARLVEMVQAAESVAKLAKDPELTGSEIRGKLGKPGEGVGVIEAARGTLFHHYRLNPDGLVDYANLIVATTHNAPGIGLSVKQMAEALVAQGKLNETLLNRVEMAFRAYDPCLACATHFLPGGIPVSVEVYDAQGNLVRRLEG
jgi:F420-non-reducing hydrogenase large subunit